MTQLNRMTTPPAANTRDMRAYMQAIQEVSGLYADEVFDLELFMRNYRTHLESGRLVKDSFGFYSLSAQGKEYFSSRLSGDPIGRGQHVTRAEVIEMTRRITASVPEEGWASFEVSE